MPATLARLHRAGELTAIRVPTPAEEAIRDFVRVRAKRLVWSGSFSVVFLPVLNFMRGAGRLPLPASSFGRGGQALFRVGGADRFRGPSERTARTSRPLVR